MKKILLVTVLLFVLKTTLLNAQSTPLQIPIPERDVFFFYREFGLPNSDALKVLVISSHIHRYKFNYGYDEPALIGGVKTALTNAYTEKMEEIIDKEYNDLLINSKNQVMSKSHTIAENAFSDGVVAQATGPELYLTLSSATDLLIKTRDRIIADYRQKGYKVFQVDFAEYFDNHILKMQLEKIAKLSPLFVEEYNPGDILELAKPLQTENSSSSSSGITVKSKSSTESSGNTKKDNIDWEARGAMHRVNAAAYEAEGDRLNKMGALFMARALEQYKLAQQEFYSDRVQQKINTINSMYAAGQALDQGLEKIDDVAYEVGSALDELKVPRFAGSGLHFSGLAPSFRSENAHLKSTSPWSTALTVGFYRLLAVEAGLFYAQSPTYELSLIDKSGYDNDRTIHVNKTSFGFDANLGFAIPYQRFMVYALYGWNIDLGVAKGTLLTEGYEYPDIKDDLNAFTFDTKYKFGINYKIPNSRIALGVNYILTKTKGDKIHGVEREILRNVDEGVTYPYVVSGSTVDIYKFSTFGFSIYLLGKDDR